MTNGFFADHCMFGMQLHIKLICNMDEPDVIKIHIIKKVESILLSNNLYKRTLQNISAFYILLLNTVIALTL